MIYTPGYPQYDKAIRYYTSDFVYFGAGDSLNTITTIGTSSYFAKKDQYIGDALARKEHEMRRLVHKYALVCAMIPMVDILKVVIQFMDFQLVSCIRISTYRGC